MSLGKSLTRAAREATTVGNSPTVRTVDNVVKKHGIRKPAGLVLLSAGTAGAGKTLHDKAKQRENKA